MATAAEQIVPGLWRWTAPHPGWRADAASGGDADWDELVGSALYELPHAAVLFDPLLPGEGRDAFLEWLDGAVAGRPVRILTTIRWHRRDRDALAARYRGQTPGAWNAVPPGVSPKPLRGAGETLYWLEQPGALICGDRVLGGDGDGDGGLRVCPESWLDDVTVDRAGLAQLLSRLLELPIEVVLTSHGQPVLHDGRAALARAVAAV
jgi:hypothetical protein